MTGQVILSKEGGPVEAAPPGSPERRAGTGRNGEATSPGSNRSNNSHHLGLESLEAAASAAGSRVFEQVRLGAAKVEHVFHHQMKRASGALEKEPLVAALVRADTPAFSSPELALTDEMKLVAEAKLKFSDEDCRLWVLGPARWPPPSKECHAQFLLGMQVRLKDALAPGKHVLKPEGSIWPIQSRELAFSMIELEELLVIHNQELPRWRRMLYASKIWVPRWTSKGHFLQIIRDQYGPDHAFLFQWFSFYAQQLWILALACVLALCFGVHAPDGETNEGRTDYEIFKVFLGLWTMALPLVSMWGVPAPPDDEVTDQAEESTRDMVAPPALGPTLSEEGVVEARTTVFESTMNKIVSTKTRKRFRELRRAFQLAKVFSSDTKTKDPSYQANETWLAWAFRMFQILVCFFCMWIFFMFLKNLFMFFVWGIMYIIYSWGDCISVDPPCNSPDGPDDKYYPRGTIIEILCDIGLAIAFEAFTPFSMLLGNWLAGLLNYQYLDDRKVTAESVMLVLASVERVGFLMILGTIFAPQWDPPEAVSMTAENIYSCFQTKHILNMMVQGDNSAFACIRSHLPYKDRLYVFTKLVKGPFMVAPFVGILVKIIIPIVAERLDFWSRRFRCLRCLDGCSDALWRIVSFIFVFDGGAVGGLGFIGKGWPYKDLEVVPLPAWEEEGGNGGGVAAGCRRAADVLDVNDPVLMASHPFKSVYRWMFSFTHFCRCQSSSSEPAATEASTEASQEVAQSGAPATEGVGQSPPLPQLRSVAPAAGASAGAPPPADTGSDAVTVSEDEALLTERLTLILQQGAHKPFEPSTEILLLKMNMVFVSFFVAVMPYGTIGVLVTLIAKLIEVKALLSKMVFVRRRVFAGPLRAMRVTQSAFSIALAAAIPAYSIILSAITYNESLYKWSREGGYTGLASIGTSGFGYWVWTGEPKYECFRGCIVWLVFCAASFVCLGSHSGPFWKRVAAILVIVPLAWLSMNAGDQVGRSKEM